MGPMLLFTGYRSPSCDLYPEEKAAMVESSVLDYAFLALSRHTTVPKTYVQDKLLEAAPLVYRMLNERNGHFYVCGDCAMAEDVANTLRLVFQKAGGLDKEQSEEYLVNLRVILFENNVYPSYRRCFFTEREALPGRHFRNYL